MFEIISYFYIHASNIIPKRKMKLYYVTRWHYNGPIWTADAWSTTKKIA